MKSMINNSIIGYELVKTVVSAVGCERAGQTHLFVCKRDSNCGWGEKGLDGIVAVGENTHENYEKFREMCPWDSTEYILWWGTIIPNYDYKKREYTGTDRIEFHWG